MLYYYSIVLQTMVKMNIYIIVHCTVNHGQDTMINHYVTGNLLRAYHVALDYVRNKGGENIKVHVPHSDLLNNLSILQDIEHEIVNTRCSNGYSIGSDLGVTYNPKWAPELQNKLIILSRDVEE